MIVYRLTVKSFKAASATLNGAGPIRALLADLRVEVLYAAATHDGDSCLAERPKGSDEGLILQQLLEGTELLITQSVAASPAFAEPLESLTVRELEILRRVANGLSNQEIAYALHMSVGTIKWYTGQIYSKLQVRSRTQAIARARDLGLLL